MEPFQKNHIIRNMESLLDNTQCSVALYSNLQSKTVLHPADLAELEAMKNREGRIAEIKLFFDIACKKIPYEVLVAAFEITLQTGVVTVLKSIPEQTGGTNVSLNSNSAQPTNVGAGHAPKIDYKKLIVGSDDCEIGALVDILKASRSASTYQNKWKSIARSLNFKATRTDVWAKDILHDKKDCFDVFENMLEEWTGEVGDDATLGRIIDLAATPTNKWMTAFTQDLVKRYG